MHSNLLITTNPKQLVKNINFNELPQLPDSQIYFDCENTFEHFNTLFKFSCPKCKAVCQSLKGLQNHLKDKHGFVYWLVFYFLIILYYVRIRIHLM